MARLNLERTIFETPRAFEYFTVTELEAQTGQSVENFVAVALKELADNALDATETAGVSPEIEISTVEGGNTVSITVGDNGSGIKPETVTRILNFDTRTSDKTVYRSPTRGAQGNALKTVLGMPHALGYDGPITITSCGIEHTIRIWTDPAGHLRIDHKQEAVGETKGTRLSVTFPIGEGESRQEYDFGHWARAFALFNPHASISYQGNSSTEIRDSYHSTVGFPDQWRKYLPTDLTSPWWYGTADLERLIYSHIADERRGGKALTLRDFVRQFRGLSSTVKAKAVCSQFQVKRLADFEMYQDQIGPLLKAMKEAVTPPSPSVLGSVGEEHFRKCFSEWFGVEQMAYKKISRVTDEGLPWVFEVALSEELSREIELTPDASEFFHGINFSPTYEDPLAGTQLECHKYIETGLWNFLRESYVLGRPVAVHLVIPF